MNTNRDNWMVWDRSPGHYEVWYATLTHRPSRTGFWIRYTLEAPISGEPYAQLWFARFDGTDSSKTFGINRRYPLEALMSACSDYLTGTDDLQAAFSGDSDGSN